MHQKTISRPSLKTLRKISHGFGGTYFPYFTSEFSAQQFSVFVNTCHRPLVHRKGQTLMSQLQKQLLLEEKGVVSREQVKKESFSWVPGCQDELEIAPLYTPAEKFFTLETDVLHKKLNFSDVVCVRCVRKNDTNPLEKQLDPSETHTENNMIFRIDEALRQTTQRLPEDADVFQREFAVEILLYPGDLLFLPSAWSASLKPLFGTSKAMESCISRSSVVSCFSLASRKCVLQCSLTAYMKPMKRTGHFSIADKLSFHGETEEEFLRKNVRKESRWDEIHEGARKIF